MVEEFTDNELKTICSAALFSGFSRSEAEKMVKNLGARRVVFVDGEVLADELRPSTQMGILLSGNLHVYDSAFKGKRHLVRIVHSGGVIGASLVGAPREISAYPALVAAHGDCVLASLPLSALYKCVKSEGGASIR